MEEKITLTEGKDFTMTALMNHLNETFGSKRSGELFNIRDVQQYITNERLPKFYGGQKIEQVNNSKIGIKIFKLV